MTSLNRFLSAPAFIVTGTARSATGYIAAVLSAAGLLCGHEGWYAVGAAGPARGLPHSDPARSLLWPVRRMRLEVRRRRAGLVGDASWLAVPWLARYRGLVYLQVRHPLSVIRSLVGMRFFSRSADESAFRAFVGRHFPITGDDVVDSMRWWVEWNKRALNYCDRWWRVEHLGPDGVAEVLDDLGIPDSRSHAARALESVPIINSASERGFRLPTLSWDDLPKGADLDRLLHVSEHFGYRE